MGDGNHALTIHNLARMVSRKERLMLSMRAKW